MPHLQEIAHPGFELAHRGAFDQLTAAAKDRYVAEESGLNGERHAARITQTRRRRVRLSLRSRNG